MKNTAKIILITFLFILNSCSVHLLNFKEDGEKLNIRIIREELKVDQDSLKIYVSTYINEKKGEDKIICQSTEAFDYKNNFSLLNWDPLIIQYKFCFEDGYPLQFNHDSSLALLTVCDLSERKNNSASLYLVDLKNCNHKLISEFESSSNYLYRSIPVTYQEAQISPLDTKEDRFYAIGSPAKWLDSSKFVLGTNEGIYLYDTNSLEKPSKMMEENIYSNFQLFDNKLINQTISSTEVIDYKNKTSYDLFNESNSIVLRKSDNYLYFIKGWSLYRSELEKLDSVIKIYEANDFVKNYWIIDDDQFIVKCGNIAEKPERDSFYYYNNENNETILIDKTTKLEKYYLSADKKYFVIKKKIIQLNYYDVLSVFDINKKVKYEFDYETIEE